MEFLDGLFWAKLDSQTLPVIREAQVAVFVFKHDVALREWFIIHKYSTKKSRRTMSSA